jgi:hypothetical protein
MKTKICRICLEEDDKVISPCNCKGSAEFVHEACLQKWRRNQRRFRCEICHSHYNLSSNYLNRCFIRLGCYLAVLIYGYTILLSVRFVLSVFGLAPAVSRTEQYHLEIDGKKIVKLLYRLFYATGPGLLMVSPSVQAKRTRVSRWTYRYIALWIASHHLAFMSPWIAFVSDLLYISLSCVGLCRLLYDSWLTSALISPAVNLILVDLHHDLH